MCNALIGVQCIGEISSVHWGLCDALRDIMIYVGDVLIFVGDILIFVGDIISAFGKCSVRCCYTPMH